MSKPVDKKSTKLVRYSQLAPAEKEQAVAACKALTDKIYGGLDLGIEVRSVDRQRLGDTIMIHDGDSLAGFAICHCGPRTEAGSGNCYVKFGAAAPGQSSADRFERLLDACEAFAHSQGLPRIIAGANTASRGAYGSMISRRFRTDMQGVVMERPDKPGYHREDVYVIDDWR